MAVRRHALVLVVAVLTGCGSAPDTAGPRPTADAVAAPAQPLPEPIATSPAVPAPSATPSARVAERERAIDARTRELLAAGVPPDLAQLPSGDPDRDVAVCRTLRARGESDAARAGLAALVRVHPDDPIVLVAAARAWLDAERPGAAVPLLERLGGDPERHPEARWLLGRARVTAGDVDGGLPLLRDELAAGAFAADAALALCETFTARESFGAARAAVDAARQREPERADLWLADARLLHDVWQLDAAAGRLDALLARWPDLDAARVELAGVERARGRIADARVVLAGVTGRSEWARAHAAEIDALRADLGAPRPTWSARDLLALVRGAPRTSERIAALQALLETPPTRARAIEVGFLQDEPLLRVIALRAFPADDGGFADALAVALSDPDARVRGTAARRTTELDDPAAAIRLSRSALDAEEDGYAFRAAHDALAARLGPLVALPADGERDPDVRNETREAWRRHCPE